MERTVIVLLEYLQRTAKFERSSLVYAIQAQQNVFLGA